MSTIEKRIQKFYQKPIPNNITFADVQALASHYGCEVQTGYGKHGVKIVYKPLGTIIPIPIHGKYIKEAYVKQLKDLFDSIQEETR